MPFHRQSDLQKNDTTAERDKWAVVLKVMEKRKSRMAAHTSAEALTTASAQVVKYRETLWRMQLRSEYISSSKFMINLNALCNAEFLRLFIFQK